MNRSQLPILGFTCVFIGIWFGMLMNLYLGIVFAVIGVVLCCFGLRRPRKK